MAAINELENKLTSELKNYLKTRGFIDTGDLYNSIQFTVTDNPFDIKLNAEDYIQYLDKGELLNKFLKLDSVNSIVSEFFETYLAEKLDSLNI